MLIKYNQYALNPALRGTIADPKPHIAEQLVAEGVAEYFRGRTLKEHLDTIEKFRIAALPPDKKENTVRWCVTERFVNDPYSSRFVITKTTAHETLHYSTLPADAPPHIKQRWADLHATDAQAFKDRQEFLKRQASEPASTNGYGPADVAKVIVIGAKGVVKS